MSWTHLLSSSACSCRSTCHLSYLRRPYLNTPLIPSPLQPNTVKSYNWPIANTTYPPYNIITPLYSLEPTAPNALLLLQSQAKQRTPSLTCHVVPDPRSA